jgi:hypothetical protein
MEKLYSEDFTADEKEQIISSLKKAIEEAGFKVEKTWGEIIEDRGSQITYSALGQQAPLEEKKKWDPDFTKRKKIKEILDPLIPGFTARLGGETFSRIKSEYDKWVRGTLVHETVVASTPAWQADALLPFESEC